MGHTCYIKITTGKHRNGNDSVVCRAELNCQETVRPHLFESKERKKKHPYVSVDGLKSGRSRCGFNRPTLKIRSDLVLNNRDLESALATVLYKLLRLAFARNASLVPPSQVSTTHGPLLPTSAALRWHNLSGSRGA